MTVNVQPVLACAVAASAAWAQPVTYDFSGTLGDHFVPFFDDAAMISAQTGGVLAIHTNGAEVSGDPVDAYAHVSFAPRFDQSWTASIDFAVPIAYDTNFFANDRVEQWIEIGLAAVFTDGALIFNDFAGILEVFHGDTPGNLIYRGYYASSQIDGDEVAGAGVAAPGEVSGTITLSFDAATKIITASDNLGDLFSVDLDAPPSDWGMSASDTFLIGIFGNANNRAIFSNQPITLDNFSAEIVEPPCLPDINGDGFVDNGDIGGFIDKFVVGDLSVDFNGDGLIDNGDIRDFIALFLAGCP